MSKITEHINYYKREANITKMKDYLLDQEMETISSKINRLSLLAEYLEVDSMDRLKIVLEFAKLFDECNRAGYIELKGK